MVSKERTRVHLEAVVKTYPGLDKPVLDGVDMQVESGESLAIVGPSGSGKSTLLHLIGALDTPGSGTIRVCGQDLAGLNEKDLAAFRCGHVGFVFQLHYLLPQCTALENVLVPSLVRGDRAAAKDRARAMLTEMGLAERMDHRPGQLSGGERQRVAVARALINEPELLLADEPTGALDHDAAMGLMAFLSEQARSRGITLIVVTHSREVAGAMDRVMELRDGALSPLVDDAP